MFLYLYFPIPSVCHLLKEKGVGDWMTNLATAAVGGSVGGLAKAVVASAAQGTVSGYQLQMLYPLVLLQFL